MYTLQSATVLARTPGAQWQEMDLSQFPVIDIFNLFYRIYLKLKTQTNEIVFVDFSSYKSQYSSYSSSLTEFFTDNPTLVLDTILNIPSTTIKYARYSNAIQANYKIDITNIRLGQQDRSDKENNPDLKVSRPFYDTDAQTIYDYCLMSVNGFFHSMDTDSQYCYIKDGAKSAQKCNDNHVGILSFLDVGKIKRVPINPDNIYPRAVGDLLRDRLYFTVDDDLTGKSCFLVLGGYLIFPDETSFLQTGQRTFSLNLTELSILEKLMESSFYLDLSPLGLSKRIDEPSTINAQEFFTDAVIKKYLTLSQSYLVIVDTDNLFTNKHFIQQTGSPGKLASYVYPALPLIVNYGKAAEYWRNQEGSHWSVTVRDSFLRNFVLSHKEAKHHLNITAQNIPNRTYYNSRAFLLEIGTEKN